MQIYFFLILASLLVIEPLFAKQVISDSSNNDDNNGQREAKSFRYPPYVRVQPRSESLLEEINNAIFKGLLDTRKKKSGLSIGYLRIFYI